MLDWVEFYHTLVSEPSIKNLMCDTAVTMEEELVRIYIYNHFGGVTLEKTRGQLSQSSSEWSTTRRVDATTQTGRNGTTEQCRSDTNDLTSVRIYCTSTVSKYTMLGERMSPVYLPPIIIPLLRAPDPRAL
eukprot:scaffold6433_cov125-Cylindrotheca_fusiformis.AAC.22